MRLLPEGLQAHLDSGATTLCWCWKVVRQDGTTLGFTDHDNDLVFDEVTFEAGAGFTATDTRHGVGLNVDNSDIEGALQSGRITESDLLNGHYDEARVELYRVNWSDLAQRVFMRVSSIGEVTRDGHGFRAELRGLTHSLGQTQGRLFQRSCDADLGDARCTIDRSVSAYTASGQVGEMLSPSIFTSPDVGAFPSGWFTFGQLRWTSGENTGRIVQIKSHRLQANDHRVQLWAPMRGEIETGDVFEVTAGCDKQMSTCVEKFANGINFQGFPDLPGSNYVTTYPNSDDPK